MNIRHRLLSAQQQKYVIFLVRLLFLARFHDARVVKNGRCVSTRHHFTQRPIPSNVIRIHLVSSPLQPYSWTRVLVSTPNNEATSDCVMSGMLSKACHFRDALCCEDFSSCLAAARSRCLRCALVPPTNHFGSLVRVRFWCLGWRSHEFPRGTVDTDGESRCYARHGAPQTRAATDRSHKVTNSNLKGCSPQEN